MKTETVQKRISKLLESATDLMIGYNAPITEVQISESSNDDEFDAELSGYSNAGENLIFSLSFDGSKEDFVSNFEELSSNFDPEEHAEELAELCGTNGVPSLEELISDAEEIEAALVAQAEALRCCLDKNKAAERRRLTKSVWRDSRNRFQRCVQRLNERMPTERIAEAYCPQIFASNVLFLLQKEFICDCGILKTDDEEEIYRILRDHRDLVQKVVLSVYRDVSEDKEFWGSLPESANLIHLALEIARMKADGR